MLDRDLRVKHLKKWTFWGLLKTDVLDRGIPWTELILRDQRMPNDLNLQISQRVSIGLVYLDAGLRGLPRASVRRLRAAAVIHDFVHTSEQFLVGWSGATFARACARR